jgi:hypothetical protein
MRGNFRLMPILAALAVGATAHAEQIVISLGPQTPRPEISPSFAVMPAIHG